MASDSDSDCEVLFRDSDADSEDYKGGCWDRTWRDEETSSDAESEASELLWEEEEEAPVLDDQPADEADLPPAPEETLCCTSCYAEYPLADANDHNLCQPCRVQNWLHN
jgi:hypothetical protein